VPGSIENESQLLQVFPIENQSQLQGP